MINVTESAGNHLKSIQEDQGKNIMLGVRGGGCAGFAYDWQLMEDEPENWIQTYNAKVFRRKKRE